MSAFLGFDEGIMKWGSAMLSIAYIATELIDRIPIVENDNYYKEKEQPAKKLEKRKRFFK